MADLNNRLNDPERLGRLKTQNQALRTKIPANTATKPAGSDLLQRVNNKQIQANATNYAKNARSSFPVQQGHKLSLRPNTMPANISAPKPQGLQVSGPLGQSPGYEPVKSARVGTGTGGVPIGEPYAKPANKALVTTDPWTGKGNLGKGVNLGDSLKGAGKLAGKVLGGAATAYTAADKIANSEQNILGSLKNQPNAITGIELLKDLAINKGLTQPLDNIGLIDPMKRGVNAVNNAFGGAYDYVADSLSKGGLGQNKAPETALTAEQTNALKQTEAPIASDEDAIKAFELGQLGQNKDASIQVPDLNPSAPSSNAAGQQGIIETSPGVYEELGGLSKEQWQDQQIFNKNLNDLYSMYAQGDIDESMFNAALGQAPGADVGRESKDRENRTNILEGGLNVRQGELALDQQVAGRQAPTEYKLNDQGYPVPVSGDLAGQNFQQREKKKQRYLNIIQNSDNEEDVSKVKEMFLNEFGDSGL